MESHILLEAERAFQEMTNWLKASLRDLHNVEHVGVSCDDKAPWFVFDETHFPYIRCDDWRSVCVERRDKLIAITLISYNGALSNDFIDVSLITHGERQVDRVRMLPSKTNPHERWCHLRWADVYSIVRIEFIPVHGPKRF